MTSLTFSFVRSLLVGGVALGPTRPIMRIVSLYGHTFDLDQIASSHVEGTAVALTFRNADRIHLSWRDSSERTAVLTALELHEGQPGEIKARL